MSHRRLPVSLRDKITKYYEHRFQGKLFDEERILSEVSRPLRKVGTSTNMQGNLLHAGKVASKPCVPHCNMKHLGVLLPSPPPRMGR